MKKSDLIWGIVMGGLCLRIILLLINLTVTVVSHG